MEMQITVVMLDTEIRVKAPFNKSMNEVYKRLGGRWDGSSGLWVFKSNLDLIKKELEERFGITGSTADLEIVTAEGDTHNEYYSEVGSQVWVGEYDASPKYATGVALVSGGMTGPYGSVKYPELHLKPGSVFRINLPRAEAETLGLKIVYSPGTPAVTPSTPSAAPASRSALMKEKEAILARLTEINTLLSDPNLL